VIFFNSALAACVLARFSGKDPDYKYGISEAKKHRQAILGYSVLAATVGLVLQIIAERAGWLAAIISNVLGLVWSVATIFIAPVLITTDLPPLQAVKKSAQIFIATWGKTLKGAVGFGLFGLLAILIFAVPAVAGIAIGNVVAVTIGIVIAVAGIVVSMIVISTCSAIYRTALFHYATTKKVPAGFSANLPNAVKAK
jgi:hypothetical protein